MKRCLLGIMVLVFALAFIVSAAEQTNLALGKKYVVNYPPESSYPDNGVKLTDGKLGSVSIYDSAYAGYLRNEYRIFIIDLEAVYNVDAVTVSALKDSDTGVNIPLWLCFAVSTDGKRWKSVDTLDYDEDELPSKSLTKMQYRSEFNGIKARYVAVKLNVGVWTFIDEIEVLGDPKTQEDVKAAFSLTEIDFEEIEFDY